MAKKTRRQERRDRKKVSAKRRLQEHSTGFQSNIFKLPEGVNFFRVEKEGARLLDVIPFIAGEGNPFAEPGEEYYERTFWTHRGIGSNNESYVCPAKTAGKPCPICEYRQQLNRDPDTDEKEADALKPKERQLWLLRDRKDPDRGLQIWEVSHHLFGKMLDSTLQSAEEEDGWEYFADPVDGFTLKVMFEENTYAGNKFYDAIRIDFRPREPLEENIAETVPCLDDLLIIEPYKKLEAVLNGMQAKQNDDEQEEEEAPRSRRRKSTPPPDDVEVDDDDDDAPFFADEDDDDEEEEIKPKRGRKPAPVEDDDDDLDEEDDDLEDEEEVKPKPKPVKTSKRKPPMEDEDEDEDDELDPNACLACDGSGENSKGKPCVPCKGTGKKQTAKTAAKPKPAAKAAAKPTKKQTTKTKQQQETEDLDDDWDDDWED